LVKQKRLAPTAPIPCVIRTEGLAQEDSLAENITLRGLARSRRASAFETDMGKSGARQRGDSDEKSSCPFQKAHAFLILTQKTPALTFSVRTKA